MSHLAKHVLHDELRVNNVLHVVAVISNPARYNSRYRLAREFIARMQVTPNVRLYVVEAAHGDHKHEVTEAGNDRHLQLRVDTQAWIKENMINLGVKHLLPRDWRYIAWVDADVEFRSPSWAQDTLHQLQHFAVVQPWSHCADLGARGAVCATHASFGFTDSKGTRKKQTPNGYSYGHTGYAWACTRAFWEQVEGLVDFCCLGSADHHMALACVGECERTIHTQMISPFFRKLLEWQARAVRATHREVGFVEGRIEHHFHGKKAFRYYKERWQILVDHGFDPDVDLMKDAQGVIRIVSKPALDSAIRKYNRARNEDSGDE